MFPANNGVWDCASVWRCDQHELTQFEAHQASPKAVRNLCSPTWTLTPASSDYRPARARCSAPVPRPLTSGCYRREPGLSKPHTFLRRLRQVPHYCTHFNPTSKQHSNQSWLSLHNTDTNVAKHDVQHIKRSTAKISLKLNLIFTVPKNQHGRKLSVLYNTGSNIVRGLVGHCMMV